MRVAGTGPRGAVQPRLIAPLSQLADSYRRRCVSFCAADVAIAASTWSWSRPARTYWCHKSPAARSTWPWSSCRSRDPLDPAIARPGIPFAAPRLSRNIALAEQLVTGHSVREARHSVPEARPAEVSPQEPNV